MNTYIPIIINWNDFNLEKNQISLTEFVENNSIKIRKTYIDLINLLGEKKINNVSLIELLKLDNNYSIWWMSLLYEKNFYKSPQVLNSLKVIALQYLILDKKLSNIKIINLPNICNKSIIILSKKLKINIELKNLNYKKENILKKILCKFSSNLFRSIFTLLKYSYFAKKVKNFKNNDNLNNDDVITIVSYFLNYNNDLLSKNLFYSDYWGNLNNTIKKINHKIRWLHIISDKNLDYKKFKKNFEIINADNKIEQHHFLESNITNKIIINTLFSYLKIYFRALFFKKQKYFKTNEYDVEYLWDILKFDLFSSISGPNAIRNILIHNLFNSFFEKNLNHSKLLYLHEGQGWEKSLIYLFKKNNENIKKIIGVIQSPIRFWDLKLFDNFKSNSSLEYALPFPDKLAINTYNGIEMIQSYGINKTKLVAVEPLRYKKINIQKPKDNLSRNFTILILGSFVHSTTLELINSINIINNNIQIVYKFRAHPGNKIANIKKPICLDENTSIEMSIAESDLLIIAGDSSVAVDSYLAKKNIIIFLGSGNLNYSPLRKNYGVKFASNKKELNNYIKTHIDNLFETKLLELKKIYFDSNNNEKWEELLR